MHYLLDFVSALHIGTFSLEMGGVDYFDYLPFSLLIILHQNPSATIVCDVTIMMTSGIASPKIKFTFSL